MSETHKIHDPFTGKQVEISSSLVDRLRGKYASEFVSEDSLKTAQGKDDSNGR